MALIAGNVSLVSKTFNAAILSATPASGSTNAVTTQCYRSTDPAFVPAPTLAVGDATLTVSDFGLLPATTYYYIVRYTDSVTAETVDSTPLSVLTWAAPSVLTDPVGVQFCNERIRPFADLLRSLFYTSQSLLTIYTARTELAPILPDEPYATVQDGLNRPMSGHDVQNIINWANQVIALGSGYTDMLDSIEKCSMNGRAIF